MSLLGAYETSKLGPTTVIAFNGSAGAAKRIRLAASGSNGSFRKVSYALQVTENCRVLQGDSTVTVTATTGFNLKTTHVWRVDVESTDDAYISVLGATADAGNIEITILSAVTAVQTPTEV